jgi:hypothetical protein
LALGFREDSGWVFADSFETETWVIAINVALGIAD